MKRSVCVCISVCAFKSTTKHCEETKPVPLDRHLMCFLKNRKETKVAACTPSAFPSARLSQRWQDSGKETGWRRDGGTPWTVRRCIARFGLPYFTGSFHLSDMAWQKQPTLAVIMLSLSVISLGSVSEASHERCSNAKRKSLRQMGLSVVWRCNLRRQFAVKLVLGENEARWCFVLNIIVRLFDIRFENIQTKSL